MARDQLNHSGKHWSELITKEYPAVINYGYPGASNGIISYHLYQALYEYSPTAVVVGFTNSGRIEFKNNTASHDYKLPYGFPKWMTNCHYPFLSGDQKLAVSTWQATSDIDFVCIKDAINNINLLYFLKSQGIPFVFTLGLFEHNLDYVPDYINNQFEKFSKNKLPTNLTNVPSSEWHDNCCFHLPQLKYQEPMAEEVLQLLTFNGL